MATKTWIATTASTWATAASWSPVGVPISTDDVVFSSSYNGDCSIGATATCTSVKMVGYSGTFSGTSALNITGANQTDPPSPSTFVISSTCTFTYSGTITFTGANPSSASSDWAIYCNGKSFNGPLVFNGNSSFAWHFWDEFKSTSSITFTAGILSSEADVYVGSISTSNSNVRQLYLNYNLYLTGSGALITATNTTNLFWIQYGNTYVWGSQTLARTLTFNTVVYPPNGYCELGGTGSGSITLAVGTTGLPNVTVTNTGGAVVSFSTGSMTSLTFNTGTNVVWTNAVSQTIAMEGDLKLTSTMGTPTLTPSFTFRGNGTSTPVSSTITLAGKSLVTGTITLNDGGGGYSTIFADAFSSTGAIVVTSMAAVNINAPFSCTSFTHTAGTVNANAGITTSSSYSLTAGTLNLGSYTHNFNAFSSSNTNIRTLDFGTSTLNITGNAATVWTNSITTNFTFLGNLVVNFTYSGSVGTRTIAFAGSMPEASAITVNITAGSDTVSNITGTSVYKNLNFTGFSGIYTGTAIQNIYGNVTFSSTQTVTQTGALTFLATSATQTLTSNGVTLTTPIIVNSATTTVQNVGVLTTTAALTLTTGTLNINGNLVMTSLTATFTFTAGTINVNNGANITCGLFSSSNSNTRTLNMGWGTWNLTGTGTAWNLGISTGMTLNAQQSRIVFSNTASPLLNVGFSGGGLTYYTVEYARGAATGALSITGSNTFANFIDNTSTAAHNISISATATNSFYNFVVKGSSGALVTVTRGASGTFIFQKVGRGIICNCDYITLGTLLTFTPANTWYLGANSVNPGTGTGYIISNAPSSQSLLGAGGVG